MSIIIVMFVLPQILLLGEKIIDRTSFAVSIPLKLEKGSGLIMVDGYVRGQLNGTFIGEMHGLIRGDASLFVTTGEMQVKQDSGEDMALLMEKKQEEEKKGREKEEHEKEEPEKEEPEKEVQDKEVQEKEVQDKKNQEKGQKMEQEEGRQ